ncbi:transketolase [Spirochaeta dissipatitropha]
MNNTDVQSIALAVRSLTIDAVQAANSGHPGLPMGLAEVGSLLYGEVLQYEPSAPDWANRDRFILSAGHGSMLVYSLLHLSGFDLSLDELKNFRQVGSKTPGHPEWGHTVGVETTTGPLGQGFANAVGMAIAETMAAARFNTVKHSIVDHYTYAIAGDGCMMEGVTSEAASLAAHLELGKLIVFYDDNNITIDGATDITFTEDVAARYEAYGWQVLHCDAYDIDGVRAQLKAAKAEQSKPTLIIAKSLIGKGSPNKAGTSGVHGAALGVDEVAASKRELGIPADAQFYIPKEAQEFFARRKAELADSRQVWESIFAEWSKENPELRKQWDAERSADFAPVPQFPEFKVGDSIATRSAGEKALKAVKEVYPNLVGGSADLIASNKTKPAGTLDYQVDQRQGTNINYGVREHAMASISNGIALYGGFRSFCATFLVFADYMRPAIRLAAIMKLPAIYVFTHDSIFVGEDGPTHQPIEHFASLRIIPGLHFYRPADALETAELWQMAMERIDGPTALSLTRQNIPVFARHDSNWKETIRKGAYIAFEPEAAPDIVLVASGSEVAMAIEAAKISPRNVRVVSMPSRELFLAQSDDFRAGLIPAGLRVVVAEAGVSSGWEVLTGGRREDIFGIDDFGLSGPAEDVAEAIGFTAAGLAAIL